MIWKHVMQPCNECKLVLYIACFMFMFPSV